MKMKINPAENCNHDILDKGITISGWESDWG